jgi:serine protease Do
VIVSKDGYIITNNHVVEQADDIVVLLSDKRELSARLIGTDPKTDLAVIKIEASNLPYLKWGDSTKLQVGEMVLAVGSPFGLSQTVTMGIVSAVGRANVGIVDYEDFIQTDAAINPGNSGGALVNLKGELVGINTAIFSRSGGYMGIGFAIPSRMAETIHKAIVEHGKVIRGWLGVSIQNMTPELAEQFHAPDKQGALVSAVVPDSPAQRAGLERGDIVREFADQQVTDREHLRNLVGETPPGRKISLTILREGQERTIRLTLGEQPRELPFETRAGEAKGEHVLTGVIVESLPPEEFPGEEGVIVRKLQPGSPADRGGLRIDDVILEINRKAIRGIGEFNRFVQQLRQEQSVLLLVRREKGIFFIPIKP